MSQPIPAAPAEEAARHRLRSLRSRLMLLVLALLLPALGVAAMTLYAAYLRDREAVERHLQETTRALALVLDRHFGQAEALIWALATSPQLEAGDYAAFDARARAALRLPEAWVVVEEPGRQVVNTRVPFGSALPAVPDQRHWADLTPERIRISDLFVGLVSQRPTISVETLVAGEPKRQLAVLMTSDAIGRILSDQRLPPGWIGAIIDRKGTVVARSRNADRFVGRPATPDTLQQLRGEAREATYQSTSLDGIPTVVAFSRSPDSGWTTIIAVPQAELTATARLTFVLLAGAGGLLLALGIGLASLLAKAIADPVESIAAEARALASGAGSPPTPPFGDFKETAAVRAALLASASALRQRQAERDKAEADLRALNETLEQRVAARTEELAAANRRLRTEMEERAAAERQLSRAQRLEAVGQLTGGLAHDFNNLLTAVLGSLEMLGRRVGEGLDERSRRLIENATGAAERGAKLTAQLLAFSRRQRLEPRATDVNASIEGVAALLRSTLGGTVRIETRLRSDLWPALADPTQLELIVLNLALNARDAMPLGGALTIETTNVTLGEPATPEEPPAGEHVMVAVSDTGTGIPPEVMARVFEPFFTTKEVGKGSGLGLSQVLGIAKQLGGGVRIETRPGEGTSVQVFLTRAAATAAALPVDPVGDGTAEPLRGRRILLVDDDGDVRRVVAGLLREAGAEVSEAASGVAAVELFEAGPSQRPDLVLLDYAMPGMTGAAAASRLRELDAAIPIALMTGYADAAGLPSDLAVSAVLGKPFKPGELGRRIAALLGPPPGANDGRVVPLRRQR